MRVDVERGVSSVPKPLGLAQRHGLTTEPPALKKPYRDSTMAGVAGREGGRGQERYLTLVS